VRLEFIEEVDGNSPPRAEVDDARTVYETPYGSLAYSPTADVIFGEIGGVRLSCNPGNGVAEFRVDGTDNQRLYFATHPLATIALMELLERRSLFFLHAACLVSPGGIGIVLSGQSGAGKSTLALALARSGMGFLSDDVTFIRHCGERGVQALGFADPIGVSRLAAEQFSELRPQLGAAARDGFRKPLARAEELFGRPSVERCMPGTLVFPKIVDARSSALEPLPASDAFIRLVPDVLVTHRDATQAHLAALAALVDQVQCYELRTGRDLAGAVELMRSLA
jgi:hypothetical protein